MVGFFSAVRSIDRYKWEKFLLYCRTEGVGSVLKRIQNYFLRYGVVPLNDLDTSMPRKGEPYDQLVLPEEPEPLVSIVLPVYNKWPYTYHCLRQILKNTTDVPYEVILADDVSTDETKDAARYVKNLVVSRNTENLGFLRNCNRAVKLARGRYVHFLNNDTNVQKGWLSSLVRLLEAQPDIGMAGSKLVYANGRLQEAGGILWRDGSAWNYGHIDDRDGAAARYVKDVDYISGASMMIRRTLWEKLGGFDERYAPAYCEDSDLAFMTRQAGFRVVYQPLSVVVHFEGISNGTHLSSGIKRYQPINQRKFFEKWQAVLAKEHFPNGQDVFWARDRSYGRKTIVVVDHYVPHYDCDAGGRTTFHYLNFFVQLGLHVIFVGDNYFCHQPYTMELEQLGIEVLAGDGWSFGRFRKWLDTYGRYVDFVYLNRPHIAIKYIDLVRERTQARIFYYGHDLHFIREQRQYEVEHKPELLKSIAHWKRIECDLVRKADVVHTPGAYEEQVLQAMFPGKPIHAIPIYLYERSALDCMERPVPDGRDSLIFVGGFNHQPNEDAVHWFMADIYPELLRLRPGLRLFIVGSHPTKAVQALASDLVTVTGYVSDEALAGYYQQARVAVVPLRYGAGIKGKIVESMYFGLPVVTTTIGAEGLPNVDSCIAVTDDPSVYVQRVWELLTKDTIWEQHSAREMAYVRENFTTDRAKEILLQDLK